jgi:hypothetical protein
LFLEIFVYIKKKKILCKEILVWWSAEWKCDIEISCGRKKGIRSEGLPLISSYHTDCGLSRKRVLTVYCCADFSASERLLESWFRVCMVACCIPEIV